MPRDNPTMYDPSTGTLVPFKPSTATAPSGGRMYKAPFISTKLTKSEAAALESRPLREYPPEFSARPSRNPLYAGKYVAINKHSGTPVIFSNDTQGYETPMAFGCNFFWTAEDAIKAAEKRAAK